jgi:DNA-binding LacI/PurR family transcriptional regulator
MNITRRANSQDVATLAGVSQATVSRAFTPGASISDRARKKIEAAAAKLGYQPNIIARSLSKRRSRLVGLLFANWTHPKAADLLKNITEALTEHDYKVIVQSAIGTRGTNEVLREFLRYQVDGAIIFSAAPTAEVSAEFARAQVPIVLLNHSGQALNTSSVSVDAKGIGHQITSALLARAYKRLALISANPHSQIVIDMTKAIVSTASEHPDMNIVSQQTGIDGYEAGMRAIENIWKNPEARPDAIVCTSDNTALGILAGCRQNLDIKVPDQLAIVGLGDIPASAWKDQNLSTIKIPHNEMVNKAVSTLIASIEDSSTQPESYQYQAEFIQRGTTRLVSITTGGPQ